MSKVQLQFRETEPKNVPPQPKSLAEHFKLICFISTLTLDLNERLIYQLSTTFHLKVQVSCQKSSFQIEQFGPAEQFGDILRNVQFLANHSVQQEFQFL